MINKLNDTYNDWGVRGILASTYTCGYCGSLVSSDIGMPVYKTDGNRNYNDKSYGVYICTKCKLTTFIYEDVQVPGFKFGNQIEGTPDEISSVYDEARSSFSVGSYTAVILLCRKLLMHAAVNFGASEGKSFKFYVDYLRDNHYVSPLSGGWVDSIRGFGNEANHEIKVNTKKEAEIMIKFCEMILKANFEYPALLTSEQGE